LVFSKTLLLAQKARKTGHPVFFASFAAFSFATFAIKGFCEQKQKLTAEFAKKIRKGRKEKRNRGESGTKVPFRAWAKSSWPKAQSVILTGPSSSCILAKMWKKICRNQSIKLESSIGI
jgi:hypothetical protein